MGVTVMEWSASGSAAALGLLQESAADGERQAVARRALALWILWASLAILLVTMLAAWAGLRWSRRRQERLQRRQRQTRYTDAWTEAGRRLEVPPGEGGADAGAEVDPREPWQGPPGDDEGDRR
jgi:hypothetical protein